MRERDPSSVPSELPRRAGEPHARAVPAAPSMPEHAASRAPSVAPSAAPAPGRAERIAAIDFARGLAIALMILSHGVNGLLEFDQFAPWGLVPVHAVTKFASSLFIVVFGIALAVAFVPRTGTDQWPRLRTRLFVRGLVVLFWYKALTVVEMLGQPPAAIADTLLYRDFPSYVEILGFYAIALLWIPFALPAWRRLPAAVQWSSPVALALIGLVLARGWDFAGLPQLRAVLVEHPDYYTWGQVSRGPLVLLGLLIGGLLLRAWPQPRTRRRLGLAVLAAGALLLAAFALGGEAPLGARLHAIALNGGKHPPELAFMLWSLGGALVLLGLAVLGGNALAMILRPVTVIGSDALKAFVFHIVVIFLGFRYLGGLTHDVDYATALALTLATIAGTAAWIAGTRWIERHR